MTAMAPLGELLPVLATEARRRMLTLGTMFAVIAIAALAIGVTLPRKYESSTTILVQESNIVTGLMEGRVVATGVADRASIAREVIFSRKVMCADFFVNPGKVGEPGLAGWAALREMADAGMSIQSHGWNHTYFSALDAKALREDLTRSRAVIEDRIGRAVTLLAPPGGRMPRGLDAIARECGYSHVLGSVPGRIGATSPAHVLPRMSVTAALDLATLEGWVHGRGVARARLRYDMLHLAKQALGDRRYERWRGHLLGRHGDAR